MSDEDYFEQYGKYPEDDGNWHPSKSLIKNVLEETYIIKKEKFYCWNCSEVEIPEPVRCCSGRECGCQGLPIEPPFCSEKCTKEYYKNADDTGDSIY